MPYATPTDVADELGRDLTPEEERQVPRWIASCELIIRRRLGPLDALDAEALRVVIPQAVARKAINPEGKTSERIDDYYYTRESGDGLALTAEEWEMLTPPDARVGMEAFTVRPVATPYAGGCGAW